MGEQTIYMKGYCIDCDKKMTGTYINRIRCVNCDILKKDENHKSEFHKPLRNKKITSPRSCNQFQNYKKNS